MIQIHVLFTLLSYAFFWAACVVSVLFLVQERQLKRKEVGDWLFKLPSLEVLDRLNLYALGLGFLSLSVGVLFGFLGIFHRFGHWWTGDPKQISSLALWGWYLVVWIVRLRSTLRGKRAALLAVLGFGLVIFTGLGAKMLGNSAHPYV